MKFVSQCANLRIVLKNGIPSDRTVGRAAVPGLYVRFVDGIAEVKDEEMAKLMLAHPGYERDFIIMEEVGSDPYAKNRKESEPAHQIGEIKFGQVVKGHGTKVPIKFSPEQEKAVEAMVEIRAKELIKEVLKASQKDAEAKVDSGESTEEVSAEEVPVKETKSKVSASKKK